MKTRIADKFAEVESPSSGEVLGYNIMSFLPSILVVLINFILTTAIWAFERVSLYTTVTDMQAAVARNLALAQFINTALIAIPIHLNDWYGPHGLVVEMYNIMISNAIVAPLIYLLSPAALVKKIRMKLAQRKGERSLLTQQEANVLGEAIPVNMPALCASMMKTVLLSLMYAPLLPIGVLIGIVALGIQYWVSKYMLLRRHRRPVRLSDELDDVMLRLIPIGCAAYAAANFYFFYDLNTDAVIPGAIGCGLVFLYITTPIGKTFKAWVKLSLARKTLVHNEENQKSYEESAVDFFQDYDRENPVTAQAGAKWWMDLITHHKGSEAAQAVAPLADKGSLRSFVKGKVPLAKTYKQQKRQAQNSTQPVDLPKSQTPGRPTPPSSISAYHLALIKGGHKRSSAGAVGSLISKQ